MHYSSPIPTPQLTVRHLRKRHKKARNGRLYVFLLFAWLRAIDVATVYYLYPRLPVVYKQDLVVALVTTAVWTSGLLLAIWFKQNWAKYVLVATLLTMIVSTLSMIPRLPDVMQPLKQLMVILGISVVYLPVALVLMTSRQIHKLTRGEFE